MTSNFLNNLKNAVETGEFNSEAAKKITEISKLADEKVIAMTRHGQDIEDSDLAKPVDEKIKQDKANQVSPLGGDVEVLNSKYEKKMEEIKKQDIVNKQLAILIDIEDMVKLSIEDMLSFCDEVDEMFLTEFSSKDPTCSVLVEKIGDIRKKYLL